MDIWKVLGISATKDKDAIRTAYRTQLRKVNPEDDPEGFMALRQAYETALSVTGTEDGQTEDDGDPAHRMAWDTEDDPAVLAEMTPEERTDRWILKAEDLYSHFYDRIRCETWSVLLEDDICQRLDMADDTREEFLQFLMTHTKFPNRVWKMFDSVFSFTGDSQELKEKFPADFIDYVKSAVMYEGVLDFDLFSGKPDADYDLFIEQYFMLRYNMDCERYEEARSQIAEMEALEISHPYFTVEQSRLMVADGRAVPACELLEPVAEKYDHSDYVLYFFGEALAAADRDGRARETFEQVLALTPQHYMAKLKLADLMLKGGKYKAAKDAYLALIDINEHDELVIEQLKEANRHLIPAYEEKIERCPEDMDSILELGWCLCQNEAYERCLTMLEKLVPDEEYMYDYTNLRGRILLCMNKYKEALPYLLRWREMILATEDDGEEKTQRRLRRLGYANYAIAMSYAADEVADYENAMTYMDMAIETEKGPDQLLSCYYGRADIFKRQMMYEKAIDTCTELLERERHFYPAIVLRMECFMALGYGRDVIGDYDYAVRLYPEGERPYELAAELYLNVSNLEKAREVLENAEANKAVSVRLSVLRLKLKRKLSAGGEDYRAVIDSAKKLLEENKEIAQDNSLRSECYYLMAMCCCDMYILYEKAEVLDEAVPYIDQAIRLNPSGDDCQNIKAYIFSKQGRYKDAIAIYKKLLEGSPDSCFYMFRLASVYGDCRDLKNALAYYEKVAALDDKYPDVHREIGVIYRELAEEERQRRYYRIAVEAFNKQIAAMETQYDLIERGRLYLELGMYDRAEADIRRTLEINPDNIYAYNAMGDIARYQRRYQEAVAWYQKGVDHVQDDNTPVLYENMAQCYECMGQYDKAEQWYHRALALYPERGRLYEKFGAFYVHTGRYDQALEIYKKGQTLNTAYRRYFGLKIAKMVQIYAPKEAYKIYKQLYKENNQDVKACYGIARYYLFFKDKLRKAIDYYQEGMQNARQNHEKDDYRDGCFGAGLAYYMMGKRSEASKYFMEALNIYKEAYPDLFVSPHPEGMDANDYYMIGRLFALAGDTGRAAMYFEGMKDGRRCCEYCTSCTCFEYLMGRALLAYTGGNVREAVQQYRRALQIAGNDWECMTALRLLGAV